MHSRSHAPAFHWRLQTRVTSSANEAGAEADNSWPVQMRNNQALNETNNINPDRYKPQ